jgi:hypothetical protein
MLGDECAASNSAPPTAPVVPSGIPAVRASRRVTWGAARAMKATGPATAVTALTSATPTPMATSRVRPTCTPDAAAASSPRPSSHAGTLTEGKTGVGVEIAA